MTSGTQMHPDAMSGRVRPAPRLRRGVGAAPGLRRGVPAACPAGAAVEHRVEEAEDCGLGLVEGDRRAAGGAARGRPPGLALIVAQRGGGGEAVWKQRALRGLAGERGDDGVAVESVDLARDHREVEQVAQTTGWQLAVTLEDAADLLGDLLRPGEQAEAGRDVVDHVVR